MSGEQVRYDPNKEFSRIENWKEFLIRWESVETEEEAVGLLYCGIDVPTSGEGPFTSLTSQERLERIGFYLDYAKHSNEKIAATVQQIIIRHWLKQLRGCSIGYDEGCLEITNRVLEFLQSPNELLLKPPHPRFVSEYLLPLHEQWRYNRNSDYSCRVLQGSTKLIVRALCAWGLGYVLAVDGLRQEIIPIIKEFLDERGYQTGEVFFKISGHGEPPSDLSGKTGTEKVNYTAACAFLKLMFWVGGGFTANFIRIIPPVYQAE